MMYNIRKYSPCLNCGKLGHEQKQCKDPVTSWGIILVKTYNNDNIHFNTDLKSYENCEGIRINNKNDLNIIFDNMTFIKFLLVRRKHSLGFAEFIRGKYNTSNINGLRGLFNQMIPCEIDLIRYKSFDELWNLFWGINEISNTFNSKEYINSKTKFTQLKSKSLLESDLDFYLDTAMPIYLSPEWGFPKGRKKKGETDIECALREFNEETSIKSSDVTILYNIKPIEEELIGTNGIKYKHIYYLAEINDDKYYDFYNNSFFTNPEIGDMNFFTLDESIRLIRDYHV
jgi:ADP-ribose pyrophosphatase YjhB (NUDIX family)